MTAKKEMANVTDLYTAQSCISEGHWLLGGEKCLAAANQRGQCNSEVMNEVPFFSFSQLAPSRRRDPPGSFLPVAVSNDRDIVTGGQLHPDLTGSFTVILGHRGDGPLALLAGSLHKRKGDLRTDLAARKYNCDELTRESLRPRSISPRHRL